MASGKTSLWKRPPVALLPAQTLKLRWPFGQTLFLSLFFFCVFYIAGEGIARTKVFRSYLITETWNSSHRHFERQLSRLNRVVIQGGKIDCIFLGNSMVWRGFNPEVFRKAYRTQTGEDLSCFNFGVDGLPASSAGALAEILVEDYKPKLLIFGTDARDYAVPIESKDARVLADMPWLQYRLGRFSLEGWFIEHSYLYRYRISLKHLLRFDYQFTVRSDSDRSMSNRYGFDSDPKVGDVINPPDIHDSRGHVQYYYRLLSNYEMLPENLAGLQQVLSQREKGVQVLVVEMPVPPTYLAFFGNQERDYQRFLDQVSALVEANHAQMWQTTSWRIIPDDGWVDYSHLNTEGAKVFSAALGERLGQAVLVGLFGKQHN